MVECGGLENRCSRERTGGSNPSFSANYNTTAPQGAVFLFPGLVSEACLCKAVTEIIRNPVVLYYDLPGPSQWDHDERSEE